MRIKTNKQQHPGTRGLGTHRFPKLEFQTNTLEPLNQSYNLLKQNIMIEFSFYFFAL